jgi:hypothetical protein
MTYTEAKQEIINKFGYQQYNNLLKDAAIGEVFSVEGKELTPDDIILMTAELYAKAQAVGFGEYLSCHTSEFPINKLKRIHNVNEVKLRDISDIYNKYTEQ